MERWSRPQNRKLPRHPRGADFISVSSTGFGGPLARLWPHPLCSIFFCRPNASRIRLGRSRRRYKSAVQDSGRMGVPQKPCRRAGSFQREADRLGVVKLSDQQIVAFGPQCTHLGCAYHWEERSSEFLCPCHSSALADCKVISGPAPRPLDRFDTKIENGKLLLGALHESQDRKS